ncbi:MAG: DALR anticodon-binding domain-containing protein, partial [Bdellovibrionota bacterium]
FNDLSTDRVKDVEFDWERILDFEGDTGPYLQYSYARACSIMRQGAQKSLLPGRPEDSVAIAQSEAAQTLMKQFGRLEESLEGALRLQKPSIVANYAIDLAKTFNAFYRDLRVVDESQPAESSSRLGLVLAFRQVFGNTLSLLCMRLPEEM